MPNVEVYTRTMCMKRSCRAGHDEDTKKDCVQCKGEGYIEEWVDFKDLLRRHIG